MKRCSTCRELKSKEAFSPNKQTKDRLQSQCRECKNLREREKRRTDETYRAKRRDYVQSERVRKRRTELYRSNPNRRETQRAWKRRKRSIDKAWVRSTKVWEALRRVNRVPRWVSHARDILPIYRLWYEKYGKGFVVDHIIPVNGALVCGLHTPNNLRITSERANTLKGNDFDDSDLPLYDRLAALARQK